MYLQDISDALTELNEFISGKTLSDYLSGALLRRGVEREFEIIGEAMSKMVHRFPESSVRIEHARRIANFRNVIAHEYRNLDDELVWDVVLRSAPVLRKQVELWLSELDATS